MIGKFQYSSHDGNASWTYDMPDPYMRNSVIRFHFSREAIVGLEGLGREGDLAMHELYLRSDRYTFHPLPQEPQDEGQV